MKFLIVPLIVGVICVAIYNLFELFARRRERMALIEKLAEIKGLGEVNGNIDFTYGKSFSCWALRGGCLLIGLGLGVIVGYFITSVTIPDNDGFVRVHVSEVASTIYCGSLLLFGGAGLLLAFILEMKYLKKDKK